MLKPLFIVLAATLGTAFANPIGFIQTNLASDASDSDLVNPWGIVASSSSPFGWERRIGKSLIYNGAGVKQGLVVSIPGDGSVNGVAFSNTRETSMAMPFYFLRKTARSPPGEAP